MYPVTTVHYLALSAALVAAAFLIYAFPNPLNPSGLHSLDRLASSAQVSSSDASGRLFMDQAALRIAAKHPLLGAGGGAFRAAFLAEQGSMLQEPGYAAEPFRYTQDAHNDWLQLAAESGFPALLLFTALFAAALRSSWKSGRWPLAALLVSFGVDALFHFPLAIVPSAALAWLGLGWAAALEPGPEPASSLRSPSAWRGSAWLPLLAAFVFMRQLGGSALLNHGMNLSLGGRPAEAPPAFIASARIAPWDERPWMRLGLDADARGDLPAAEAAFTHCQGLPEGLSNLALVQAKQGRVEEARASCLKSLALNPKSTEALGNFGKIEYLRGDAAAAEAAYLKGLSLDPNWAGGHFNLAAIYLNSGRKAEARPQLQEALRLDPSNGQAAQLLKGLK